MAINFIRFTETVKVKQEKRIVSVTLRPLISDCIGSIYFTDLQIQEEGKLTGYTPHTETMLRNSPNPIRFCSDECRVLWWNSHSGEVKRKALYSFKCASCGEDFTAYGNAKRRYCSHSCYCTDRFGRKERQYEQG